MNIDAFGNFVYARQVFTALDNFVLGMLLYWVLTKYKFKLRKIYALLGIIAVLGVCYKWNHLIDFHSPYGDDWWGYIWHTVFAVILTVLIYLCSQLNIQFKDGLFFGYLNINMEHISGILLSQYLYCQTVRQRR